MHGLGNDFVILDDRDPDNGIGADIPVRAASLVADRRFGIGCDQLLIIRPSDKADIFMQILNNDGSTAGACGNGTRCVADYVMRGQGVDRLNIETDSGILSAYRSQIGDADLIAVNMGVARLEWHQVPLAGEQDTLHVDLGADAPALAVCHSMGNPHAVMFVEDVAVIDLEDIGPNLEHADIFPDRANISIVQKLDDANSACVSGNAVSGLRWPVGRGRARLAWRHIGVVLPDDHQKSSWMAVQSLSNGAMMARKKAKLS